ncbi:MerR family transcriptional regulator [Streptomyces sp. NPDC048361]|uniref:MerR family transcriptional regulator n=1 Tax=Streptomyces sp. NPDC048361 TaxID=3154720 RepID=UPI0034470D0B
MSESTWKVDPLAEAAGLTVRTLHHWDTIGLLTPSRRTPAGHREYTEADVGRLYQVLALRGLGLGLDTIALCLDAGVDPARVLRAGGRVARTVPAGRGVEGDGHACD